MTPAKRRPATPASQGPTRVAPDVPIVAPNGPRANTNDGTQLLGPEGEPITEDTLRDAAANSAPPRETGHVDAEARPTKASPTRPLSLYPLPVWPD